MVLVLRFEISDSRRLLLFLALLKGNEIRGAEQVDAIKRIFGLASGNVSL